MSDHELVEAARKYLGVPFVHRGRSRQGLDCAGLIKLSLEDIGFPVQDYLLYGRTPHNGELERTIEARLGPAVAIAPVRSSQLHVGDVVLVRYRVEPHHVAIVTDYPYGGLAVIHTDGHTGRVVEHRLAEDMVRRITHVFRRSV